MKKLMMSLFGIFIWMAGCDETVAPIADKELTCAGAHNQGKPRYCDDYLANSFSFVTTAHAFERTVNLGQISRSTMIIGEGVVDNPLQVDFYGYASFIITTGGCNGAATWPLLEKQPVTVQAGQTKDVVQVGGQCGDMPLGPHQAVATVWQDDGVTKVGEVTINFTLVE